MLRGVGIRPVRSLFIQMANKTMNSDLLLKYLDNEASDQEMREVLDWLEADPANRLELDRLDRAIAASIIHGPLPGEQSAPAPAPKKAGRRITLHRIVRYTAEVAAVLLVGAVLSWTLTRYRLDEWSQRTTSIEVPPGQYLSMRLEDGTNVWLSAGTRFEYPLVFAGRERRVKISGEAMFDVEHDADHPFVVETFACDVEVLGTKFDVEAEPDEGIFSTALLRGSVKVSNKLTAGEEFILQPNEEIRQVGNRLQLDRIDNPDEYLWTEGLISIKGQTFEELMHKFEKYFGVRILIERRDIPTVDYNYGKIRISDGIDTALRMLQRSARFSYVRDPEDNTIRIR